MGDCKHFNLPHHDEWNVNGTAYWKPDPYIEFNTALTIGIARKAWNDTTFATNLRSNEIDISCAETELTGNEYDFNKYSPRFSICFEAHFRE